MLTSNSHPLRLFTRFAVLGVVCFLLLAFILFQVWARMFERHILREAKETRAKYVSMLVSHTVTEREFLSVKKGSEWKAFGEKMAPILALSEIAQIKVFNQEGALIWSDSLELLEQPSQAKENPDLLKALEGRVEAEISRLEKEEHRFERGTFRSLMEIYVPIAYRPKEKPSGVVEVYLNIDPLFETINNTRWLIGLTVAGGMGLLLIFVFLGSGRIVGLINRQNQDLRVKEESQKLLKELSQDVTSLEVETLCKKLTERVREVIKVDISDMRIGEEGVTRVMAVSGVTGDVSRFTSPGARSGRAKWIFEKRRPLIITDITAGTEFPSVEATVYPGMRGYLGVPLLSKSGKVIGILRVLTSQPRKFTQEEVDLLQLLANDAAIALENSRLLQELKIKSQALESANRRLNRLLQEQSALREIFTQINLLDLGHLLHQLTEQTLKLLNVDHVQVRLLGEDDVLRTAALAGKGAGHFHDHIMQSGRGRSTWAMENRRPLAVKDISQDKTFGPGNLLRMLKVKGYLVVPLISRGEKSIGVLAASTLAEKEFTHGEIALAQELAAGAAIAIENARLFEEVRKKSLEVEEAYRTKSDFFNTMAHELRTPLNVMIAIQQLFAEGIYGELSAQQKKGFEPMERNTNNLLNLINSILDLARLEAKRVPLQINEFSLREITDELESSFLSLAKEKGLNLRFHVADPALKLKSDKSKIKTIFQNLLGNAVKYTDKGEIEFRISAVRDNISDREAISVVVKDTGIGIKETDLPHIFEAFYMAEGVSRRKYPGSGLGLSIVKRLLQLLHGEIQAQSDWGNGSTFTVTLPLIHPAAPEKNH